MKQMGHRSVTHETINFQGTKQPLRGAQSGQSLLEVALVTPLLLALLVGAIELGRYAYFSILVGNAARAGAAYGSESLPQSVDVPGICNAASYDFQGSVVACSGNQSTGTNGTITITSSTSCGCDSAGTLTAAGCSPTTNLTAGTCTGGGHWVVMVSVTASGTFRSLFSYPGIAKSITVTSTSTLRVAQQ
jgi:Flp pilus assembly protein TadG